MSKLVVGVAVLLVLSLVGLLVTIWALSGPSTDHSTTATGGASTPAGSRPGGQPTAVPLTASQLRIIDPAGTRSELTGVGAMVDGDQNTFWKTEHYIGNPAFGGKKPGMGVLIDLGSPKAVNTVQITFANRGATVELRKGSSLPPATADGDNQVFQSYEPIGQPQEAGSTTVLSSDGQPVQYLLIWITKLPPSVDDPSRFQVRIQEIKVSAT